MGFIHLGEDEGFGVWGLGFGVLGLGFGVWGLGFGVWGLGFGGLSLGFGGFGFHVTVSVFMFRVQGAGVGFRDEGHVVNGMMCLWIADTGNTECLGFGFWGIWHRV